MKTNCKICGVIINKKNLQKHLLKHRNTTPSEILKAIDFHKINISKANRKRLLELSEKFSIISNKNRDHRLKIRYLNISEFMDKLKSIEYKEQIQDEYNSVRSKLSNLKRENLYGRVEIDYAEKLNDQLDYFRSLPSRKQFIKNSCNSIYFTWDDITFKRNSIQIDPKLGIMKLIKVSNSMSILNFVKESYFKRHFSDSKYKIRIKDNIVREDLSPDIDLIRNLIESTIQEKVNSKKVLTTKSIYDNQKSLKKYTKKSKKELLCRILDPNFHNLFLRIPALNLKQQEKLIPIIENNNSNYEEALIFVFNRFKYSIILWENINQNRAAYAFKYKSSEIDYGLSVIAGIIRKNEFGKRDKLYRQDGDVIFNLNCEKYYSIKHEILTTYENKLNNILNKM